MRAAAVLLALACVAFSPVSAEVTSSAPEGQVRQALERTGSKFRRDRSGYKTTTLEPGHGGISAQAYGERSHPMKIPPRIALGLRMPGLN
jgi:hypothetical protein